MILSRTLHHTAETESFPPLTFQYTVRIPLEQMSNLLRHFWCDIKERTKDRKKRKTDKGEKRILYLDINIWTPCDRQRASACYLKETGRKVPNSERENSAKNEQAERKQVNAKGGKGTSIRGHLCVLFVGFVFSLACSKANIECRNTGNRAVSTRANIEYGQ